MKRAMEHRKTRKKKKNKAVLSVLTLLLFCLLAAAVYIVQQRADNEVITEAGTSWNADHSAEYVVYGNTQYPVIRRLSTVLLIGTDNFTADEEKLMLANGYRNRSMADFLVILVFDHDKKTVTPFQFNRDTICEVPALDAEGKITEYKNEQLAFAHSYGSGKTDSCENTVKAIRRLIWNAPVDHYFAFTMDAVPLMNDLVGGVTVTLNEDLPELGEEYIKGASITLKGADALRFVRYREELGGTNYHRMRRHRLYLSAFMEQARPAVLRNQDLVVDAFKLIDPFICTDLTVNNISEMVNQLCEYEMLETVSPSGAIEPGDKFYEFHPHEDSLWNCVYTAYCKK